MVYGTRKSRCIQCGKEVVTGDHVDLSYVCTDCEQPKKATDADIIRFRLKYLADHYDELTPNELRWVHRFDDDFQATGKLSPRQFEVLEDIWNSH